MRLENVPVEIAETVRNRGFSDAEISSMESRQLFHEFCTWHGLINWGEYLFDLVVELQDTEDMEQYETHHEKERDGSTE